MQPTQHTTLLIIGGGPGGYVAAIRAGQLGILAGRAAVQQVGVEGAAGEGQLVGGYIIFAYPRKARFRVKAKGNGLSLWRKRRFVVDDYPHIRYTLHAPD